MYELRNLEDRINKYSKLIILGDVCSTTLIMKHSVTYIKTCTVKTVDSAVGCCMVSPILRPIAGWIIKDGCWAAYFILSNQFSLVDYCYHHTSFWPTHSDIMIIAKPNMHWQIKKVYV